MKQKKCPKCTSVNLSKDVVEEIETKKILNFYECSECKHVWVRNNENEE